MNVNGFPSRPRLLPFCVAVALAGLAAGGQASVLVDGRYVLGSSADASTAPISGAPCSGTSCDLFQSDADGLGNSIFFHSYAVEPSPTYFGARVSGEGTYFGTTKSTWTSTYTNNTLATRDYLFSFFVESGAIDVQGTGDFLSQMIFDIRRDNSSLSKNTTTVNQNGSSTTCTEANTGPLGGVLAGVTDCPTPTSSSANIAGGSFVIDLGTLAPGESFTLDYDIIATVSGAGLTDCGYGGGYGESFAAAAVGGSQACGGSAARSGDPFNGLGPDDGPPSDVSSNFQVTSSPAGVPEPGSLALAGAALAGLATLRRRKGVPRDRSG